MKTKLNISTFKPIYRVWLFFSLIVLIGFTSGCTHRTVSVDSDPTGAMVYFDGKPQGVTPVEFSFKWYGGHKFKLRKEGYRELDAIEDLKAPIHYKVPIDFFTELAPIRISDKQELFYTLEPDSYSDENSSVMNVSLDSGISQP